MINHIIDLATQPARLSVRHRQLVIEMGEQATTTVPLAEVAALIVCHAQITLTQSVLAGLAEAGAVCIVCDAKSRPVATMFPLVTHHLQTERLAAQARASVMTRRGIWRQIIRNKIESQAHTLEELYGDDHGLRQLARRVKSGDASNAEAVAARRYWPRLFGDPSFRRKPRGEAQNRYLNYGYAVLRAITARAITATGLHPSLGIHHHNRYNPFCLADDLMEPFRPRVDLMVARLLKEYPPDAELTPEIKARLLSFAEERYDLDGERRTLFDVLHRVAASLAEVFLKRTAHLLLPKWDKHGAE